MTDGERIPTLAIVPALKFPHVGLAAGAGLLVGESIVVVAGLMRSFGADGMGADLLVALAAYALAGAALDVAAQLVPGLPPRARLAARALPVLLLGSGLMLYLGMNTFLALIAPLLALLFVAAVHVRWALPLAAAMAAHALSPVIPRGLAPDAPVAHARPAGPAPSIAVVVLDTMRADHASAYGYGRDTTPNLTALARRGTRFERAYTTSCWSVPTHASLLTGFMPRHHGATFATFRLDPRIPTLATVLAEAGYETAGFTGNPYISRGTGFASGYSRFEEAWRPWVMRRSLLLGELRAYVAGGGHDKGGEDVIGGVRRWLGSRSADRPYFLFVNLMEAHAPYQDVPREFREKFLDPAASKREVELAGSLSHDSQWSGRRLDEKQRALALDLLDGATAGADHYLGELLSLLGPETLVIVVADHGDLVGEHDLYGHMTGLWEPLIHVPCVMAGPGIPQGAVIHDVISLVDVFPTCVARAGLPQHPSEGFDLSPLLSGVPEGRRVVHAEHDRAGKALALWVQHRTPEEIALHSAARSAAVGADRKRVLIEDGRDEGFDLASDPGELRPFDGRWTELAVDVAAEGPAASAPEMDPAQLEALRSLGYVR